MRISSSSLVKSISMRPPRDLRMMRTRVPSWIFSSTSGDRGHEPYGKVDVPQAGNYAVSAGADFAGSSGAKMSLSAGADFDVSGAAKGRIDAADELVLSCGGATITVESVAVLLPPLLSFWAVVTVMEFTFGEVAFAATLTVTVMGS